MTEDEEKKLNERAGWEAIAKMLVPVKGKLDFKPFIPKTHIDDYL